MNEKNCEKVEFPLNPIIHYISKLTKVYFRATLAEYGFFPGQEEIMRAIIYSNGISPSELAKKLNTSLASVSVSIKRLEKCGFIAREKNKNDARTFTIYPTQKGLNSMDKIHDKLVSFESKMLKDFTEEEKEQFRSFLDKIIFNISGEEKFSFNRGNFKKGGKKFGKQDTKQD